MNKRSPEELYRVGYEELRRVGGDMPKAYAGLLRAFSVMLSQAVAPGKPKLKKVDTPGGPVMAAETLYAALRNQCGPYVISQPKSKAWIPALSKAIAELEDYGPDDVQRLVSWLHSGALKDWPTALNVGHIAKHLARFVGEARKWSRTGTAQPAFKDALKCFIPKKSQ